MQRYWRSDKFKIFEGHIFIDFCDTALAGWRLDYNVHPYTCGPKRNLKKIFFVSITSKVNEMFIKVSQTYR